MVSSSGTLLVVSTLNMVWDCHLRPFCQSWGGGGGMEVGGGGEVILEEVNWVTMGLFLLEDNPFNTVKGLVDYV